jgi:hypothetical protein
MSPAIAFASGAVPEPASASATQEWSADTTTDECLATDAVVRAVSGFRAIQVALGVRRGSRRGPKGGVRIDGATQLFSIRPAMETSADAGVARADRVSCVSPGVTGRH